MIRMLDLVGAALAGSCLTILLLGSSLGAETHKQAMDGLILLLALTAVARGILAYRNPVKSNG